MAISYIPEGYHSVTPYLVVEDAAAALEFYRTAFDAKELYRLPMGDKVGHAEFTIGDSRLLISDEWPDMNIFGPKRRGGGSVSFMIYVKDVDRAFATAIKAGGTVDRALENQFWGDRSGTLVDPFGHKWTLATHLEEVSPDEMKTRMSTWAAERQPGKD